MKNIDNKTLLVGYIQAFIAVLVFFGFNNLSIRYVSTILEANPIIYSCSAFASCALVLLAYAGHGKLAKETMRSFDTWSYGFILMLSYIVGILLFGYVTSSEGTLLQKISVIMGILGGWFFLARRPDKFQWIGLCLTALGVYIVFDYLENNQGTILLLSVLYSVLQIIRIFIAELHRPHVKAAEQKNDSKARARVVAFIMFLISALFLVISFFIATAQTLQETTIPHLPVIKDFFDYKAIFAGFIFGIIIVAPLRILEFSSAHIIKAENFAAITTLSFFGTLFWEWATSPLTGLSMQSLTKQDIFAGIIITFGGLVIALSRGYVKRTKKASIEEYIYKENQNLDIIDDSRETLLNAIEHLNGDLKKVSTLLELPENVIDAMLTDESTSYAFKAKVFDNVMRNYRKNISSKDALTGLLNRAGFIAEVKQTIAENKPFALYYLDLNKFKPINDTYGHEAGDFVLQEIAKRLKEELVLDSSLARLGGDEFCIMLKNTTEQNEINKQKIESIIAKPISYINKMLEVGTSVGIANYPQDGNDAMELIKQADKNMYIDKS